MHEIVTLQLGQRSNYLATHFWNTQESYFTYSENEESPIDHDVHFRPGLGADGSETFTPRTVIYDLKGGFGSMRKINALYDIDDAQQMPKGLWDGNIAVQTQQAIGQIDYQRSLDAGLEPPPLDSETVRYWSDFNRVFYHPRSIIQLNEYELHSSLMPFEDWDAGEELFIDLDKEQDLLDRDLRPFAEEADQLQGLQIVTGTDDAWGGFAARYIDRLRDEFGKKSIWVWALEETEKGSRHQEKRGLKKINAARSIQAVASQASLHIPIATGLAGSPSYLKFDRHSPWHISALQATAVESIGLPTRLRALGGRRKTFQTLEDVLNTNNHQRIAKLELSIVNSQSLNLQSSSTASKDPRVTEKGFADTSEDGVHSTNACLTTMDIDLFPGNQPNHSEHIFGRAEILRGNWPQQALGGDDDNGRLRRRFGALPTIERYRTSLLFPLLDSFPKIYDNTSLSGLNSVAVHASLSTTAEVGERLKRIEDVVKMFRGVEERESLLNSLGEIREAYEDGWKCSDEEDDY
ncbi:MAG: mtDNA inheritance, partitioning of the mitochondrial organelle [Candelina submexicana]|nr:MAG: mtDNA inheritance, partitioning of the mitochondrial organelle [Candelina submexicana]